MKHDELSPSDMIFIGADEVTIIARGLADLASAFERTGNTVVAKELGETVEQLIRAEKMVRNGAARLFNQHLRDSTESSTNIVLAALAGIEVSSRLAASADKAHAPLKNKGRRQ